MSDTKIPDTETSDDKTPEDEKSDDELIRESAQFYFELLIDLFKESHPEGGEDTEIGKLERARNALEISWRLRDCIAIWAQAQLVGYCISKDDQELLDFLAQKSGQHIDKNSHIIEALGMQCSPNNRERTDRAFPKMDNWLEEWEMETGQEIIISPETLRSIINEMMMSRTGNSSFWRMELQHSLLALNKGEVSDLVAPVRVKRQGRPYKLKHYRANAIMHVYFRVGKGMKKYRALEEVADALAVSPETLRSWEKNLKSNEDDCNNFYCAELAGLLEGQIREKPIYGETELDHMDYGIHRGVWNSHSAAFIYRNVLSKPLDDLLNNLNLYRRK